MKITTKKGDVTDILIFVITISILAVGLFILAFVIPEIADGLEGAGINSSTEGQFAIDEMASVGTVTIQRGFFMLFAGLIIATMISSFLVRTHPIFLFVYIIFLAISILLGTYLGNMYQTISETEIFSSTLASQSLINLVMQNITEITLGVGVLSLVIVFSKFSSSRTRQDL